ncbi:MAG: hypothetical protein ACOCUU_00565 [Nanoarchaeota archaeon]
MKTRICRECKKEFQTKSVRRQYCDKCKKKRDKEYQEFLMKDFDDDSLEDA